jgi:hypothetical protein
MENEVLIRKRKKAKELHEKGWSNDIARYLVEFGIGVGQLNMSINSTPTALLFIKG